MNPQRDESVADTLRYAVMLHKANRLDEAEPRYRAVLATRPDDFDALHLLGVLEAQRVHHRDSLAHRARRAEFPS